jgi:transcription elongation factor SPT4
LQASKPPPHPNNAFLYQKFQAAGCPNCESFLGLQGNPDSVAECTSQVFEGLISLADPSKSWVARWQRIDGYVPGIYAAKVVGILPEDVIISIEEAGLKYIP